MKRLTIIMALACALTFTLGSLASAAPLATGDAGSLLIFGEFGTFNGNDPSVGLGYALTDGLALGAEAVIGLDGGDPVYGAFLSFSFGPLALSAEALLNDANNILIAKAYWVTDLLLVKLGLGGGVSTDFEFTDLAPFAAGVVSFGLGENFSLYGNAVYFIDSGMLLYQAGVSFAL